MDLTQIFNKVISIILWCDVSLELFIINSKPSFEGANIFIGFSKAFAVLDDRILLIKLKILEKRDWNLNSLLAT